MEKEYFQVGQQEYTRREKLANWFYYNKIWILVGLVVLWVVGSMVWNVLGIGQTNPDCRVLYVGSRSLPEDCVKALEQALSSLAEDYNGDGTVTVMLTQCVSGSDSSIDNQMYGYGGEIAVLADITEAQSHFFLLEDPEAFQLDFQILANFDGSAPDDDDYSAEGKVLRWGDCPVPSSLPLGSYTDSWLDLEETGMCQDLLKNLYLGRRYYYDNAPEYLAEYETFWRILTEGAEK